MGLVDYSSSSSGSEDEAARKPPAKRLKSTPLEGSGATPAARRAAPADSGMPPLPAAFHDLYASTVRQSVVDDPALHHGRKRQIPHVVGNWPTHLYVEWHPTTAQHQVLVQLVDAVSEDLGREVELHDFLTSDLGAPLPLHISLSRPIALSTADKDQFLDKVTSAIRGCGTGQFAVSPRRLAWYRSPDSNRTFLIFYVTSQRLSANPELMTLLGVCNDVAARFNQPVLYQRNGDGSADDAFHISIGWTFDLAVDDASIKALGPFKAEQFRHVSSWEIDVAGVKAKIGNVVSHVPLAGEGSIGAGSRRPSTLFGS